MEGERVRGRSARTERKHRTKPSDPQNRYCSLHTQVGEKGGNAEERKNIWKTNGKTIHTKLERCVSAGWSGRVSCWLPGSEPSSREASGAEDGGGL